MTTSDFSPKPHDLVWVRGDSVALHFRFGTGTLVDGVWTLTAGYDLTGVEFAAQLRSDQDSTEIVAAFEVTLDDQDDPDTAGSIHVTLDADTSAGLTAGKFKWDLQATWPGETVRTYLAGTATVKKDTTRV